MEFLKYSIWKTKQTKKKKENSIKWSFEVFPYLGIILTWSGKYNNVWPMCVRRRQPQFLLRSPPAYYGSDFWKYSSKGACYTSSKIAFTWHTRWSKPLYILCLTLTLLHFYISICSQDYSRSVVVAISVFVFLVVQSRSTSYVPILEKMLELLGRL